MMQSVRIFLRWLNGRRERTSNESVEVVTLYQDVIDLGHVQWGIYLHDKCNGGTIVVQDCTDMCRVTDERLCLPTWVQRSPALAAEALTDHPRRLFVTDPPCASGPGYFAASHAVRPAFFLSLGLRIRPG